MNSITCIYKKRIYKKKIDNCYKIGYNESR